MGGIDIADSLQVSHKLIGKRRSIVVQPVDKKPARCKTPGFGNIDLEFEVQVVEVSRACLDTTRDIAKDLARVHSVEER